MSCPPPDWATDGRLQSFKLSLDGDDASDEGSPTPSVAAAPTPAPPTARRGAVRVFRTGRAVGRASTPPLPPPTLPEEVSALAHLPAGAAAVNGGGEAEEGSLIVADGALETPDGRPSAAALAAHRAAGGHAFVGPVDREQVAAQRRAVWDIVKGLGGRLLRDGLNLTRTSLPVAVFEPRSFVQRVADNWAYLGLLDAAARSPDPAERARLVAAFIVGGLSRQTSTLKPFNPILGETWAAAFLATGGGRAGAAVVEEGAGGGGAPGAVPPLAAALPAVAAKKAATPAWVRSLTTRRAGAKAGSGGAGAAAGRGSAGPSSSALATPPPAGWAHAGAAVWAEQISHHPPATAWLVESRVGREGRSGAEGGATPAEAPSTAPLSRAASLGGRRPASSPPAAAAAAAAAPPSAAPPPNSWTFTGVGTWAAHFRGNSIAGRQAGRNALYFAGDPAAGSPPSALAWELPPMAMKGIMWGARVLRYTGTITVTDAEHGIVVDIGIGGPPPPGSAGGEGALGGEVKALQRRPGGDRGAEDGGGLRPDDLVGVLLVGGKPVDTLVGSWLSHADWLGRAPLPASGRAATVDARAGGGASPSSTTPSAARRLWDATRDAASAPLPLAGGVASPPSAAGAPPASTAPTPRRAFSRAWSAAAAATPRPGTPPGSAPAPTAAALPSDALAREDLVALKGGDPAGSQAWKTALEERQRAERGWRKAGREAGGLEAAE